MSVVIVTWNEEATIAACLPSLVRQLKPTDELIVSDNASTDGTLEVVRELAPEAKVVQNGRNLGFPGACNSGAAAATGDLLVLLNPDTRVADGWREAIERPLVAGYGWEAWQALGTMGRGTRINSDGGVIHFTGIAWAGHMGEPIANAVSEPAEIDFPSGACMAMELATWQRVGGMAGHFHLYYDDVDIALKLRLAGGRIGLEPSARVDHEYEFSRRDMKWRMLERNRWGTIITTYPTSLLALVMPALIVTELVLLAIAAKSGWGRQKLAAIGDVLRSLPAFVRERRTVQATRVVPASAIARRMTADLSSPYLGPAAGSAPLHAALSAYWRVVTALLR